MNKRKTNQMKTTESKKTFLFRIAVIAVLITVLLSACGKKKGKGDNQASETAGKIPSAAETTYDPSSSETAKSQGASHTEEIKAEASETAAVISESVFYPLNFSDASSFQCDYGFSEDRAWVRTDTFEHDLIGPGGEILYEVPTNVMVEGLSQPV